MQIWIIKRPNISAYLGNINVTLYAEEITVELSVKKMSVTPYVANLKAT